jgi:ABC-type uncharacterized transport system involved in gliding motility auxiliary subunit
MSDLNHEPPRSRRSRFRARLKTVLASAALVAAVAGLAWLSSQYQRTFDWTFGNRNTLTEASRQLLKRLDGPIVVSAFVKDDPQLHRSIRSLVSRYQRQKPDVALTFIDPVADPQRSRELDVQPGGQLVVEYQGRREKLTVANEQSMTNALLRLAGSEERWIVFLEGHGERNPHGKANHDLEMFAKELQQRGMHVQSLDLAKTPVIPDNTSTLVIAGPQSVLPTAEIGAIEAYLDRAGNLLWLNDPEDRSGLKPLADRLGVEFLPGVIISARTPALGVRNPSLIIVDHYRTDHPLTRNLVHATLFPVAAGIETTKADNWKYTSFLQTSGSSWTETGDLQQPPLQYDAGTEERRGPLDIGVSLIRTTRDLRSQHTREQRVVITGDGDFISNAFLANGSNEALGLNMIQWLSHDDRFIAIPPWAAEDVHLELTNTEAAVIKFGFPFGIPALLIAAGFLIRHRRHRRR